jgi:nucleotide-binding universal stress UspA family protein
MTMKTIVALVDLSDLTFKVLKQAHTLAKAFDSEVIILHVVAKEPVVVDVGIVSPTVMRDPSPEDAQKEYAQLLEMRDSLVKFGVRASVRQLERANVRTVLEETKKLQADLIILGSHHHSTLYNVLIGTVTEDVLRHAHCPVLVVPGDQVSREKK